MNRHYKLNSINSYGDFYDLIATLIEKGIYTPALLEKYSQQDISYLVEQLIPERDKLLHYLVIYTLAIRYLDTDHEKRMFALLQERCMIIAVHLIIYEDE